MRIQHVITDSCSRSVARTVWLMRKCINVEHDLCVISDKKDVSLETELDGFKHYVGKSYVPTNSPSCSILHSLSREHIRDLNKETICVQEEAQLSPAFGIHTIALSQSCANKIRVDDVVNTCGFSNEYEKRDRIVIGLITECVSDADEEEANMFLALAESLPDVRFILPHGTLSFMAALSKIEQKITFMPCTEESAGACDIAIFTQKYDPVGDLVAGAILSRSVPVVCVNGAQKEYVPTEGLVYTTYHQAVKICWRLVTEQGRLDMMQKLCKDFHTRSRSMVIFRRNLVRQLSKVVTIAGVST